MTPFRLDDNAPRRPGPRPTLPPVAAVARPAKTPRVSVDVPAPDPSLYRDWPGPTLDPTDDRPCPCGVKVFAVFVYAVWPPDRVEDGTNIPGTDSLTYTPRIACPLCGPLITRTRSNALGMSRSPETLVGFWYEARYTPGTTPPGRGPGGLY